MKTGPDRIESHADALLKSMRTTRSRQFAETVDILCNCSVKEFVRALVGLIAIGALYVGTLVMAYILFAHAKQ
jgi:hypothetical protein